jgi:hypothetical protein
MGEIAESTRAYEQEKFAQAKERIDFHLWRPFIKRTTNVFVVGLLSATLTVVVGGRLLASNGVAGSPSVQRSTKDATPPATKLAITKSGAPVQDSSSQSGGPSASKGGGVAPQKLTIRAGDGLRFDQPVPFGAKPVLGQTLEQLAKGEPLFAPIEGLPVNLWKKSCTTCHKWNKARLCDQGASYVKSGKSAFRHQHPYGGPYKLALMRWASSGCK